MRLEKQLLLDEVKEQIDGSDALIVVSYKHLGPKLSWNLSKQLSEKSSLFEVVKKRIFAKALKETHLAIPFKNVRGHIGVVFIKGDIVGATKVVCQFSEDNDDLFEVIAGHFEEKIYSAKDVAMLATLPTKKQMQSEFIALLQAPLTQTLSVMEGLVTSIMYCLENKSKKEN